MRKVIERFEKDWMDIMGEPLEELTVKHLQYCAEIVDNYEEWHLNYEQFWVTAGPVFKKLHEEFIL